MWGNNNNPIALNSQRDLDQTLDTCRRVEEPSWEIKPRVKIYRKRSTLRTEM